MGLVSTQIGCGFERVDRTSVVADPYTIAYGAKNGWISRRIANGLRQYRVIDVGSAAIAPTIWRQRTDGAILTMKLTTRAHRTMTDDEESDYRHDFWGKRQARARGQAPSEDSAKNQYVMNLDRKILLQRMLDTQDWIDATMEVADPYTFAYCAQAGWIERRRRNGQLQFRITDDGIGALSVNR